MIQICGSDIETVKIHDRYADQISDILINLQDDTAKRMEQLLDESHDAVVFLRTQLMEMDYSPRCTCGMDDNMHESDCAIVEWGKALRA